jgi:NADH-quinone oxidoreductase subunit A
MDNAVAPAVVRETQSLMPFLVYSLGVVAILALTLLLAWLLGSRTVHRKATDMPFESGIVSVGSAAQLRLSVEFYLVAMFFVIFDLETIFIFAWAVAFYDLGWPGYAGSAVFIGVLLVALIYEWRTGALDWGTVRREARLPRGEGRGESIVGGVPS